MEDKVNKILYSDINKETKNEHDQELWDVIKRPDLRIYWVKKVLT